MDNGNSEGDDPVMDWIFFIGCIAFGFLFVAFITCTILAIVAPEILR